jgi:hypothetical protein
MFVKPCLQPLNECKHVLLIQKQVLEYEILKINLKYVWCVYVGMYIEYVCQSMLAAPK